MTVKKEEFLALKQGPMSVSEYQDKFLQLSRYAPEDVNIDAKRQYHFLRGLVDPLQYHLMNHTFPTFQHLIDRAIMTEKKRKDMEDRNRKISGPQPRSINRPHFSGNSPQQFRQNQRPPQQQQFRGSTPSTSSRIVRTISQEEVSSRGRISRHLVFPPQQPTRAVDSTSSRWKQSMFPLWRARPLGDAMFEEGNPAAVRPWRPSNAECIAAWSRQPLPATLQPWETEPLGG
jgi:hypothetical protein